MNRQQRRAAKKGKSFRRGDVVQISYSNLMEGHPNLGLPVNCYICGTSHKALGLAFIQARQGDEYVPLCEPCLTSGDKQDAVARRYMNADDLVLKEGGKVTTEQIEAISEKLRGVVEH
jgi:hypothetical protein